MSTWWPNKLDLIWLISFFLQQKLYRQKIRDIARLKGAPGDILQGEGGGDTRAEKNFCGRIYKE